MAPLAPEIHLNGQKHYRIIPSVFPSINFFEHLVDPAEMETLWEIESLTNERLRQETGDIFLVPTGERVSGPGSSVVMAAFTHIGKPSRFTDGSYGVYYASLTYATAIKETIYHREQFLRATREAALEITMRSYEGSLLQPLHDLRGADFAAYHHHDDYHASQSFGKKLRDVNAWGILYRSVRDHNGHCIAIFRPSAISIPKPLSHLRYVWNGVSIVNVFDTKTVCL